MTQSDLHFAEEFQQITRSTKETFDEKIKSLANFLAKERRTLAQGVQLIKQSNKTGWKEALGEITELTGYSLEELGISRKTSLQIRDFCKKSSLSKKEFWNALLTKTRRAFVNSKRDQALTMTA